MSEKLAQEVSKGLTIDEILNSLTVKKGAIKLNGSISYIRNRQQLFHKNNPDKKIRVMKDGTVRRVR